jgi:hypothetical protein
MFAKIKNTTVLKYPYTFADLKDENPHTNFGVVEDLKKLYDVTEDAEKNGSVLQPVSIDSLPSFDPANQNCVLQSAPVLKNASWVLPYAVTQKTQAEIDKYVQDTQDGTA